MKSICLFLLMIPISLLLGQHRDEEGKQIVRCTTSEVEAERRRLHPQVESAAEFEAWMQRKLAEPQSVARAPLITLPVVVHVIHNGENPGGGSNISQAQVQSQIEVLNEDFRRKPGTNGFNSDPQGADIEIEFCLAAVDPDGNLLAEPGIHRVNRNTFNFSAPPHSAGYINNTIKPATIWDPNQYMNIWVVDTRITASGKISLGFAQAPSSSGLPGLSLNAGPEQTDGIVINYRAFGNNESPEGPFDLIEPYTTGRTTTHEVGHWLGLLHTWAEGGCEVDDFCEDTPAASGEVFECPENIVNCGGRRMVENYMEYTDDACMNIFTQDQRNRMRVVVTNSFRRNNLLFSDRCDQPQTPPLANFEAIFNTACPGTELQFTDKSTNSPSSWEWSFPGGIPNSSTEENPAITYPAPGTYEVALKVANLYGEDQITRSGFIQIDPNLRDQVLMQDFESGASGWVMGTIDNGNGWKVIGVNGTASGTKAAYVNAYLFTEIGERFQLTSPSIDLRNRNNLTLSFDYAYKRFTNSDQDSLIVYASTNGGASFPFRLFADAENGSRNFATGPNDLNNFIPQTANDWCFGNGGWANCQELDLSEFNGVADFRLRFEVVNDNGNNLFLDNITIESDCVPLATPIDKNIEVIDWNMYPNPTSGTLTLEFSDTQLPEFLTIHNLMGQELLKQPFHKRGVKSTLIEMDLGKLPDGLYFIQAHSRNGRGTKQIQLVKNR